MAWAMSAASGMMGQRQNNQTGYQDSTNNNAVGPAIPETMQQFMGVPMQRLNDKIMADRRSQANRAASAARIASQNAPRMNASDAVAGKSCNCG